MEMYITMSYHETNPNLHDDEWADGQVLGYDNGDIRGAWAHRSRLIIPKIGEVAILLGLSVEDADPGHTSD